MATEDRKNPYSLRQEANTGDCSVQKLVELLKSDTEVSQVPLSFEYDPRDPSANGGRRRDACFPSPRIRPRPGNVFQRPACERNDIISYKTETLKDGLLISGEIRTNLTVSSTAPDTSFTFKLIEEFEDGRAINIRDAITSLAFRNGSQNPDLMSLEKR